MQTPRMLSTVRMAAPVRTDSGVGAGVAVLVLAASWTGARAADEFGVPVIGVAKSAFRTATHAIAVLRGTSARPLYVTAAGMPRADAADLVGT